MAIFEISHGTSVAYDGFRCRCAECRDYQRDRVARNRAQRLASGNLNHGTRSAYDAGCRCEACRATRLAAAAKERLRRANGLALDYQA